jgi:manganese transport protein
LSQTHFVRSSPVVPAGPGDAVAPLLIAPWTERTPGTSERTSARLGLAVSTLGPAFVASVAYVDPGNFATNFEAGSEFGYLLLWVVVGANAMAMVIQYLSAKLGVATGRNLPELCRVAWPRAGALVLWIQAEVMAIATDLAELVGAALGLNLLFGLPMALAGGLSAVLAFAVLRLESRGYRRFELAITALLCAVAIGFVYEACRVGPSERLALGALVPHFSGSHSALLAVGIVGATVMPHAIYLHSDLAKRHRVSLRSLSLGRLIKGQRTDVIVALGGAGLINVAMLVVAAKAFHHSGNDEGTLQQAHASLGAIAGGSAALAFAATLFVSGVTSSTVGTYAGQVVMQGFTGRAIPVTLRRAITVVPALVIVMMGFNTTQVLIFSQVVLSFGIPFVLVPLVILTARRSVMGPLTNRPPMVIVSAALAGVICGLNLFVLWQVL